MRDDRAPRPGATELPEGDETVRHISPYRVLSLVAVLAAGAYGGVAWTRAALGAKPSSTASWFAPYVDTTATPTYPFQSAVANPARQSILGFVVAQTRASCTPSWGGAYTLAQADQELQLGTRIAQLGQNGAGAIVSFGGQANTPLEVACRTTASLVRAYASVVDRYDLHTVDLDVEGAALADPAANRRDAAAVRSLQLAARRRHRELAVWLTLPVEPDGLQRNGLEVLDAMLAARVELAGLNVMSMDFSSPPPPGTSMLGLVEDSLDAADAQLAAAFQRAGVRSSPARAWHQLGTTVMIGQNDESGERFTTADATGLVAFARRVGLERISMWSLNRDSQCGSVFSETGVSSNVCSGTPQSSLQFSHIFARLAGVAPAVSAGGRFTTLPPQPDTNPANAPFPLWSADEPYPQGYKVVQDGEIYQAQWYNSNQDPSAQLQTGATGPWLLIGPVLPSDHAPRIPTLAPGTYPTWSSSATYRGGQRVMLDGLGYVAKWDNEGASPAGAATDPAASPWRPLFTIPGEPAQ